MTPQQLFTEVAKPEIQRSTFDRSHRYMTTMDSGLLIPFYFDEALPGDTIQLSHSIFGRISSPLWLPLMDNIYLDIHYFSVPRRLTWTNWQRFNGEQDAPTDTTNYLEPTITAPSLGYAEQSIYDYFGLPTKVGGLTHNAHFLRSYNLIYNQFYRDQNLQNPTIIHNGDGPDNYADYTIKRRGKRKDYFTSALPFAQKAQPVSIPLGGEAPIEFKLPASQLPDTHTMPLYYQDYEDDYKWKALKPLDAAGAVTMIGAFPGMGPGAADQLHLGGMYGPTGTKEATMALDMSDFHTVNLSGATAVTINALREAVQIQRLYERDARGGTRYTELLQSHFGVTSPDARLQRPEFLGSDTITININPVAQTTPATDGTTGQGNLTSYATFSGTDNGFIKSFTEHELVIGIASIRMDLTYQQGLDRMWSRQTRFDHYWPALAHLGEQPILQKELVATDDEEENELVFGYAERWSEYRYKISRITGKFRSNAAQTLDAYHGSQFLETPRLNGAFIEENPPMARLVQVPSEPHFLMDAWFNIEHTRPMPTFSIPGLMDHF